MRTRILASGLLLGAVVSSAPAQNIYYGNLLIPSGVIISTTIYNGNLALVLVGRGTLVAFGEPNASSAPKVTLTPLLLGVLDTRPCAPGSRYALDFGDQHWPAAGGTLDYTGLTIGTAGLIGTMRWETGKGPSLQGWYVSYCNYINCLTRCGYPYNPEYSALYCTVQLN